MEGSWKGCGRAVEESWKGHGKVAEGSHLALCRDERLELHTAQHAEEVGVMRELRVERARVQVPPGKVVEGSWKAHGKFRVWRERGRRSHGMSKRGDGEDRVRVG